MVEIGQQGVAIARRQSVRCFDHDQPPFAEHRRFGRASQDLSRVAFVAVQDVIVEVFPIRSTQNGCLDRRYRLIPQAILHLPRLARSFLLAGD